MAIGLNSGSSGGDFLPIVTFDARAGRMFRVDRTQDSSGVWVSDKTDITGLQPTFMVDFRTLETGFAAFLPTGPSFAMAPLGQPAPAKPSADHKPSFRMKVYSPKFLDGLREFSSSSKAVIGAIDHLHNSYEAAPEARAGKLPVVKFSGATPITTKGPQGTTTNYAPVFDIVSWADRPADWSAPTVPLPAAGSRTAPPPAAAAPAPKHVPPPAPKPAPATATAPVAAKALEDTMPF
jgi:hypothetical protein